MRRMLFSVGGMAGLLLLAGGVLHKQRPTGVADAEADALARRIEAAVERDAWDRTTALTWTFGGRNTHLWDRSREFSQVEWKHWGTPVRVQVDLGAPSRGRAWKGGEAIHADDLAPFLSQAYAHWINDSFWLNPLVKLFDEGTIRRRVPTEAGQEFLMLEYTSGGLTPGDAYLYHLDANARPTAWQMWVSIIPVGGVKATWDDWIRLETGAWVSTRHELGLFSLKLEQVRGAETLQTLVGAVDPFAGLATLRP